MSDQFKSSKIQLWQFLLEILTEKEHRPIIRWNNDDGEFEFLEPGKKMIKYKLRIMESTAYLVPRVDKTLLRCYLKVVY